MPGASYYSTPLTANGGVTGNITVASSAAFVVGAHLVLDGQGLEPLEVKVQSIFSPTVVVAVNLDNSVVNLSAYTTAALSRVTQYAQRDVSAFIPGTYVQRSGDTMTGALSVGGIVESTSGGIKFPDATIQTTAAAGGTFPIATVTSATTLTSSHHTVLANAGVGGFTITLPAAASVVGRIYVIKKIDTSGNVVVVDGAGAETIDGIAIYSLSTAFESVTIQSNGTAWFIL